MASTIELQTTINWAQSFADFIELNIGSGNEPALTNANTVLQTIVGPPFKWNWNRTTVSFATIVGTQDYVTSAPNFGFLESGSCTLGSSTFAIPDIKQDLTVGNEPGRPQSIAPQIDDNAGNITFRLLPVPDQIYTVVPYFQKSPPLFTVLTQTWAPIPDKFQYIYNWGFLALTMAYSDDQRFPIINQKFIAHLLGAQQGLSETERNLFLNNWTIATSQQQVAAIKSQQGRQALGT